MVMKRISVAACLFIASLLAACGGDDGGTPEPTAYEDMTFDERFAFMNDVVLPEMKKTFVAFDPKFEAMTCATCHGSGAADGTYAMPTGDIPRLPPTEEEFYEYIKDEENAKWALWMQDTVWPQMADLLKVEMFSEENPTGFSCSNCHKVDGQP